MNRDMSFPKHGPLADREARRARRAARKEARATRRTKRRNRKEAENQTNESVANIKANNEKIRNSEEYQNQKNKTSLGELTRAEYIQLRRKQLGVPPNQL